VISGNKDGVEQGARVLDCRRIGVLTGTYGTILSGTKAMVVRFRPSDPARIVFEAHHGSARTRTCRSSP